MQITHTFRKFPGPPVELIEERTGDSLVDSQGRSVEGTFKNQTFYPEHTARDMINVLTKQVNDAKVGLRVKISQVAKFRKDIHPVDAAFFAKYKSCQSKMQIDKTEEAIANELDSIEKLEAQLERIRECWPELFR